MCVCVCVVFALALAEGRVEQEGRRLLQCSVLKRTGCFKVKLMNRFTLLSVFKNSQQDIVFASQMRNHDATFCVFFRADKHYPVTFSYLL